MREPHWHNPAEWAVVIEGTCRATFVDMNEFHPSESWNFEVGDVWEFPSNRGHAVLGLEVCRRMLHLLQEDVPCLASCKV